MAASNFLILYVKDPLASESFYSRLLGLKAIDSSPGFVLFALPSGLMLGLWAKHTVKPAATTTGGGELAFTEETEDAVRRVYAVWKAAGATVMQEPEAMDFGFTFTAEDPDGHRLRVFAPTH